MLKIASATPDNYDIGEICESASRIFNMDTVGRAEQEYRHQFDALGIKNVNFSLGLITALHAGVFQWTGTSPNNFSFFTHFVMQTIDLEDRSRHMFLHLVTKEGKGKTMDEITADMKQVVVVPASFDELLKQLSIFHAACKIWFGTGSFLDVAFTDLLDEVKENEDEFDIEIKCDKKFTAKFLFTIDKKVQRFVKSCSKA